MRNKGNKEDEEGSSFQTKEEEENWHIATHTLLGLQGRPTLDIHPKFSIFLDGSSSIKKGSKQT